MATSPVRPVVRLGATGPVFVDASGRRRRTVSALGYAGAVLCATYMAAVGVSVTVARNGLDTTAVGERPGSVWQNGAGDPVDPPEVADRPGVPPAAQPSLPVAPVTAAVADTTVTDPTSGRADASTVAVRNAADTGRDSDRGPRPARAGTGRAPGLVTMTARPAVGRGVVPLAVRPPVVAPRAAAAPVRAVTPTTPVRTTPVATPTPTPATPGAGTGTGSGVTTPRSTTPATGTSTGSGTTTTTPGDAATADVLTTGSAPRTA